MSEGEPHAVAAGAHMDDDRAPQAGSKAGDDPEGPIPMRRLLLPAVIFAGVQLAWAVQVGHFTAHLRRLGLPSKYVGLAWLGGPVSGIVVQPLVGVASDGCRGAWGRRRPFIAGGALAVAVWLVAFGWAGALGGALGDPVKARGGGSRTALGVALAAFWALDVAINAMQMPARALLADMVPASQLVVGNSLFAVSNGAGKAVGYLIGGFHADVRLVCGVAACCVLLLSLLPTLLLAEEEPVTPPGAERSAGSLIAAVSRFARELWASLVAMPRGMRHAFGVQFLSYLAFSMSFMYLADYVGSEVFGGNAAAAPRSVDHATYSRGVLFANRALFAMASLSIVCSLAMSRLTRLCGFRVLWGASLAVMGIAFLLTLLPVLSRLSAVLVIISMAPALSAAITLPWALASASLRGTLAHQRGLYLATFNLSQATPGVVGSLLGTLVTHLTGRVASALAAGGAAALIGAVACTQVQLSDELITGGAPVKAQASAM